MDCAENDFNDTCAESIDSCAVSFGFGEVRNDDRCDHPRSMWHQSWFRCLTIELSSGEVACLEWCVDAMLPRMEMRYMTESLSDEIWCIIAGKETTATLPHDKRHGAPAR